MLGWLVTNAIYIALLYFSKDVQWLANFTQVFLWFITLNVLALSFMPKTIEKVFNNSWLNTEAKIGINTIVDCMVGAYMFYLGFNWLGGIWLISHILYAGFSYKYLEDRNEASV